MPKKEKRELITVAEAARIRGSTANAIRDLIRRGRLRSTNYYGRVLVYLDEVVKFEKRSPGPQKGAKKKSATKKGK